MELVHGQRLICGEQKSVPRIVPRGTDAMVQPGPNCMTLAEPKSVLELNVMSPEALTVLPQAGEWRSRSAGWRWPSSSNSQESASWRIRNTPRPFGFSVFWRGVGDVVEVEAGALVGDSELQNRSFSADLNVHHLVDVQLVAVDNRVVHSLRHGDEDFP